MAWERQIASRNFVRNDGREKARRSVEAEGRGGTEEAGLHADRRRQPVLSRPRTITRISTRRTRPNINSIAGTAAAISGSSRFGARKREKADMISDKIATDRPTNFSDGRRRALARWRVSRHLAAKELWQHP